MTVSATAPGLSSTVTALLLTTDLNEGNRVSLLLAGDGDRLDSQHLSAALTLGEGDIDTELSEVEEYPAVRLIVGRLAHPGERPRNQIAGLLLDQYMPPAPDRWWLDLRGGVVLVGQCYCGAPADLPDRIYDTARAVSDSIPRTR
ncbi:hypothetical protein ACFV0L_18930 [Streptosporangium canum]|uniref:hypothetical protein n=1 Tax=Streptosporangium canum TaxID=324952 RepID=UPI0036CCE106